MTPSNLSTRTPIPPLIALASPLALAPGDLLLEIALFLEMSSDLLNFSLTSHHVFSNVSSVLYKSVVLESVEQCRLTLGMLSTAAYVARHVRELVIRPQAKYKPYFSPADNISASSAVRNIAGGNCLDALVSFEWDADEPPYYDDMWFALRVGCPQLRYIGTTFGAGIPNVNSHLFDFQNLRGFSLIFKNGFYINHIDLFWDEDEPSYQKLWKMLITRCPNLEELTIGGLSSVPTDIQFPVEGRWPRLRKLSLGDVCMNRSLDHGGKRPFISFLEAHPSLEYLSVSRHTIQPIHLASLEAASLSKVTTFSGTYQQLHSLPRLHRSVESVVFHDSVDTRVVSAPTVAILLRDLSSLTSLKISFTLHYLHDGGNILRSLIQSCPRLRHLELTCRHRPSFQLDSFAKTIHGFPKLRTLKLAIIRYSGDETLDSGATVIARTNPRLHKFSLTFIPPAYPISLPFSLSYRPFSFPFPAHVTGVFEVSCDHHGLPLKLSAVERSRFVWPWGLGVSSHKKKYWKDLRPLSMRKAGMRGLLNLVLERSSAGEEVRMILFCVFLIFLATCGIVANEKGNRLMVKTGEPEPLLLLTNAEWCSADL